MKYTLKKTESHQDHKRGNQEYRLKRSANPEARSFVALEGTGLEENQEQKQVHADFACFLGGNYPRIRGNCWIHFSSCLDPVDCWSIPFILWRDTSEKAWISPTKIPSGLSLVLEFCQRQNKTQSPRPKRPKCFPLPLPFRTSTIVAECHPHLRHCRRTYLRWPWDILRIVSWFLTEPGHSPSDPSSRTFFLVSDILLDSYTPTVPLILRFHQQNAVRIPTRANSKFP